MDDIIEELTWRGLIAVNTDLDELRLALKSGRVTSTRVRPDRARAAHRESGAAADHAPPAARRAPPDRAGRRGDRADRRPERQVGRAGAQPARGRRRVGGADPRRGVQVPRLRRRRIERADREQPGLDRADDRAGVPPRHRQALLGQPDAGPRVGEGPAGGGRDQLHRVQLPAAAGHGLPGALPPLRLHPAARRQRPVGQPGRRGRADQVGRERVRARPGHPADHQAGRDQVRQDRGRRDLAERRPDVAVRVLPVLAERVRRRGARPAARVQLQVAGGDRRAGARRAPSGQPPGSASARWPRRSPRWYTAPRRPGGRSRPAGPCSARGP